MDYLPDTNVVSEWVKPLPDPGLVDCLASIDEDRVFLSVVTLAEIRPGIQRLPAGQRGERLEVWLRQDLPERFGARVLPIDGATADAWGQLVARAEATRRAISSMDGFIAATAQTAALRLVTRNVKDFAATGVALHNPWTS